MPEVIFIDRDDNIITFANVEEVPRVGEFVYLDQRGFKKTQPHEVKAIYHKGSTRLWEAKVGFTLKDFSIYIQFDVVHTDFTYKDFNGK